MRSPANRLASATSPYLLQHAHNPVDWLPWGDEAFARAEAEQKPIFLSIGYSSCHWCHVMERESFEDPETAELLNHYFVSVKVDREERPDVDAIYQLVVQLTGRSGGWPLSAFLLPDRRPFFAGTYFPPAPRHGMPAFREVLVAVAATFASERWKLVDQAQEIAAAIRELNGVKPAAAEPRDELLAEAAARLAEQLDPVHHGFGSRPKFPCPMALSLLHRAGNVQAARDALAAMRRGGIWDQLGGGFHRYSTDEQWLVPHFEKMLYDNALLLGLATELRDRSTAAGIVSYLREIEEPDGGLAAAEDADSEGREGAYFVWTPAQITEVLGARAPEAIAALGVSHEGNFVDHGVVTGASVLSEVAPLDPALREQLRLARAERERPFRDRKVITAWNALAVAALAEASLGFAEPTWLVLAERTFARISTSPLARYSMQGAPVGEGFLEDYAYLGEAAFVLHGVTGKAEYLQRAIALADAMLERFWDGDCFYGAPAGELLARPRETFDQAVPSPIAIACKLLLRLASVSAARYAAPAERELSRLAEPAARQPLGMSETLATVDRWRRSNDDVVLARPYDLAWARAAFQAPLPNRNVVWLTEATRALLTETAAGKTGGAFVCRHRACSLPLHDLAAFEAELAR